MRSFIFLALFVSLSSLTACSAPSSVVSTDGSTSMERVVGALIEGYQQATPDVTVNYSGTGSGAGIEAVLSGVCDIGLSSRTLTEREIGHGATAHLIAWDAIVLIVHPSNPISDLTKEQLTGIFTGFITDWSQLGGTAAPIALYGRESGSGTRNAFEGALGIKGNVRYTNEYSSAGDIAIGISSNPNGIGYISLSGVSSSIKPLRINGIVCTEETVQNGSYPILRPFLMITAQNRPLSAEAKAFLDYATSEEVAAHITAAGAVPPSRERR